MRIVNIIGGLLSVGVMASMGVVYAQAVEAEERSRMMAEFEEQRQCIALNIYHESRSESLLAQRAVAYVTLNRVQSERYPETPCEVIYQARLDDNGNPIRNQCQFSWFCDGRSDEVSNQEAWAIAERMATEVMREYGRAFDPTEGATMYHATYVNPYWADDYDRTVQIDSHIFYK